MEELIAKVRKLIGLYKKGMLGGEIMPEDSNPKFYEGAEENYIYFTLPMALNYQRDSYKLWQASLKTWEDEGSRDVFNPLKVVKMSDEELKLMLTKYKVALQPNKQSEIWRRLCETFVSSFGGSVKNLLIKNDYDIKKIKEYILRNKKYFPYLSGTKILNYWLYVISNYTDAKFTDMQEISIAPDTHVLQASVRLGIISKEDLNKNNIQELVCDKWKKILANTDILPIDIHTPFWLWSRNGFSIEV